MRTIFIGSVEEGWHSLKALLENDEALRDIEAIITIDETENEKISGYKSFKDLSQKFNKTLYNIKHIRLDESFELIKSLKPDLIVIIGWSQLVDERVLKLPPLGCVGLHSTLLPKHRGRAPIPWTIIKNIGRSGNTLFYLTPGIDDGDIIGQKTFYITMEDTAKTVYHKVTQAGIDLLLEFYPQIKNGSAPRIKQTESAIDYWPKRTPKDGLIDWNQSALEIFNLIRALSDPYPGAFTFIKGEKVIINSSSLLNQNEIDLIPAPGEIADYSPYDEGILVGTGNGILLIKNLKNASGNVESAYSFVKNNKIKIGDYFENYSEIPV
jgi:methionyl-tRNA formyltransferase